MLGRLIADARSDPRLLFDEAGNMLKPHQWPDSIANSVESFKLRPMAR